MLQIIQMSNVTAQAGEKLFQYGLLGILLILVAAVAMKLFFLTQKNAKTWQKMAMDMNENFVNISVKQNSLNARLAEIMERSEEHNVKNFEKLDGKIEKIPQEVSKELRLELLVRKNNTPAG